MQLTEIRINLCNAPGSRLKAFCSLTFANTFVVRDVKLIEGNDAANGNGHAHNGHSNGNGAQSRLFLAIPSRKLSDHCPRCVPLLSLRWNSTISALPLVLLTMLMLADCWVAMALSPRLYNAKL